MASPKPLWRSKCIMLLAATWLVPSSSSDDQPLRSWCPGPLSQDGALPTVCCPSSCESTCVCRGHARTSRHRRCCPAHIRRAGTECDISSGNRTNSCIVADSSLTSNGNHHPLILGSTFYRAGLAGSAVPWKLWQTYRDRNLVPESVFNAIRWQGQGFDINFLDDEAAEKLLGAHFIPQVKRRFRELRRGSHKADLLRYCILYLFGGIYLDIDTAPLLSLAEIFQSALETSAHESNEPTFGATNSDSSLQKGLESQTGLLSTVLSTKRGHIFQAILASPPRHPLLERLILHAV